MRDMKALLDSQVVDKATVNRALELNDVIAKLREENERLKKDAQEQRRREVELVRRNDEQRGLMKKAEEETEMLRNELERQHVTMGALLDDLDESRRLIADIHNHVGLGKSMETRDTCTSADQTRISNLELENIQLKSQLLCLRSQIHEKKYFSRNGDNATVATANSTFSASYGTDCSLSSESGEDKPRFVRLRRMRGNMNKKLFGLGASSSNNDSLPSTVPRTPPPLPPKAQHQRSSSLGGKSSVRTLGMLDSQGDDRPKKLHTIPSSPTSSRRVWPGSPASDLSTPPPLPRRIRSLNRPNFEKERSFNLHDIANEKQRPQIFGRSLRW